jgi:cystathionine beta-lyase
MQNPKPETTFDFDTPINRRGTDSMKWGHYGDRDIIPLWVADMDFASPPAVLDALHDRVSHGVFGYADPDPAAADAVVDMLAEEHGWTIDPDWITWTPGLVVAINLCCRMLDDDRPGLLTAVPIYPPFLTAPRFTDRELQTVELAESETGYAYDFEALDAAITDRTGMFIFSNPQNPTGRVHTREQLEQLGDVCERHDLLICADEVHCDLILDRDKQHLPFATLSPELAARSITLMGPSKIYNLAGMMCAFAIIPDAANRRRFRRAARGIVTEINTFGYTACRAAYRECQDWKRDLLIYLRQNRDLVESKVAELPGIRMQHVEATYLAWLDCRETGIKNLAEHFENAGAGLSDGTLFGAPGFVRLNFGCPRSTLEEGLSRIKAALKEI